VETVNPAGKDKTDCHHQKPASEILFMKPNRSSVTQWFGVELIAVSLAERIVAALGGVVGITGLALLLHWLAPGPGQTCLLGSMGATAVLLFGVPHSPLSQPWPLIGGHTLSAIAGVICARWVDPPVVAGGLAVGLAIGVMHLARCLHPPGGATALTAVIGGEAIKQWGFSYVLFPVFVSAALLVILATLINAPFPWRRYPHFRSRPAGPSAPVPDAIPGPTHDQILTALREIDSFVDISEEDLVRLVTRLSSDRSGRKNEGA
jgi:CBS-domain-containing membrane protein